MVTALLNELESHVAFDEASPFERDASESK